MSARLEWWVAVAPLLPHFEDELSRQTGAAVVLACNTVDGQLMVCVEGGSWYPSGPSGAIDLLASLWPGLLAPAGICLNLVDLDEVLDAEAMALRHRAAS